LTHGHKVNFSGKWFNSLQYTVDKETEQLDYNEVEKLAHEHKPKLIIVGASAYSRTIDFAKFAAIAQNVGAYLLADIAHIAGLVAVGLHPTPVGHADYITSTTHKTLRGPRGGLIMSKGEYAITVDRAVMPGTQGGPFMNVIAAKAQAFHEARQPEFKTYQKNVIKNAQAFTKALQDHGYRIVTGGTDNHLFIVDLRSKNINGRDAELALEKANIVVSRSGIPFDPEKPWVTSGIRIGTPAITTRGMGTQEVEHIAQLIDEVIINHDNDNQLQIIGKKVTELAKQFPVYS
jgi:glycine hydroxymethyltransferase